MRFWSDRSFWQFAHHDHHLGNPFDRSLADTTTVQRPWVSQVHAEASQVSPARVFTQSLPAKGYDFFAPDGIGTDKDAPIPIPAILLSMDSQPGAPGPTAPTLTVDGAHVVSTIETLGDQDFYKVDLVAGEITISANTKWSAAQSAPLADAYLELYDSNGHLIVSADGGGPNTPEGLDALLTFTATYTGTYYLNAGAFDNAVPDGTRGDYVGDYEVFVQKVDANDPAAYHPRYTPDQPMHSIDWGTQIDRTSRNPDGDNGPRDNGAAEHRRNLQRHLRHPWQERRHLLLREDRRHLHRRRSHHARLH